MISTNIRTIRIILKTKQLELLSENIECRTGEGRLITACPLYFEVKYEQVKNSITM